MEKRRLKKIGVEFAPTRNYDNGYAGEGETQNRHGPLLPNDLRILMVGATGAGKSNFLLHLLIEPNGIRFKNLILISTSHDQLKYKFLENILSHVPEIGFEKISTRDEFQQYCNRQDGEGEVPDNSLVIFDDMPVQQSSEFHDIMRKYFTTGRHRHVDTVLLFQSYAAVPKNAIREQVNMLFIFRQDGRNLQLIYRDHLYHEIPFDKFVALCNHAWDSMGKFGCLIMDKTRDLNNGRFRRSMNEYYTHINTSV